MKTERIAGFLNPFKYGIKIFNTESIKNQLVSWRSIQLFNFYYARIKFIKPKKGEKLVLNKETQDPNKTTLDIGDIPV